MTPNQPLLHRLTRGDLSVPFYFGLLRLMLHLVLNTAGGYGLFRDEFYYIACANNLAAGYVDQPPLCAWVLRGVMAIFGDSVFAVRLTAAIAGAATVFLSGLLARRLGGGQLAMFVACLLTFSPINLAMSAYYSMNSLDILCWTAIAYVVVCLCDDARMKWWIVLGLILGFGLLNKIGVLFIGAGIFAGMLFTSRRQWLPTLGPWIAGAIAFFLFTPYIIWNMQNDWAHLEFIHNASTEKYSSQNAFTFLTGQFEMNNPVSILVWLPGLIAFFVLEPLRPYRILGWMFLTAMVILVLNGTSKAEYLAPGYAMLYAAGGVFWERLAARGGWRRYALTAVIAFWVLLAVIALPLVLPVLPVEDYIRYSEKLGMKPESSEGKELSELPQFYADMFGWKEKAKGVAEVFHALPEEDRKKCAIFSNNYGRCASIDYYSDQFNLPKTIGNHNNYWIWGTRGYTGEVMIILGGSLEQHQPDFESVEKAAIIGCRYCMPYEDDVPVFVCRGLKANLEKVWADEKHYD